MDIALPLWANPSDGYLLMKFTSQYDYQQSFLDGKLFFNTADYFARSEDKGRGDRYEGNTFVVNYNNPGLSAVTTEVIDGKLALVYRDYSSNPKEYRPGTVWDFSAAENRKRKIIRNLFVNNITHIITHYIYHRQKNWRYHLRKHFDTFTHIVLLNIFIFFF